MSDLYLTRIAIRNFRTFGALELRLPPVPGLTLIVGPNGLGKSSFFDSIEWALTGVIRRFEDYIRKSLTEEMYLTRRGAPEDSHAVQLTFDKQVVRRDASVEPDPDAVIALLKAVAWGSSIEDLSTYLAFTHFLGQASNQRFTSRGSEEQWNALKGPSGIDRLEDVRNALRGRATQNAFNRRIERDAQEVAECAERLTNWQLLTSRISRLRQVAGAAGASTKEHVLQELIHLESVVGTLMKDSATTSVFAKSIDPVDRLTRLRKSLELIRENAERRSVTYGGLIQATTEYSAIRAVADAGSPAVESAKQAADGIWQAKDQRTRDLTHSQGALRKLRADFASLQNEVLLLNRAIEDKRSIVANSDILKVVDEELTRTQRTLNRLLDEQSVLQGELETGSQLDANMASSMTRMERASEIAQLVRTLREADLRFQEARTVAATAETEISKIQGQREELERNLNARTSQVITAEEQVASARERSSEISAAIARISVHISENDTECPLCQSHFPQGSLAVLVRASAERRDATLSASEAQLAEQSRARSLVQTEIRTLSERYNRLIADIRTSEERRREVQDSRERLAGLLTMSSSGDLFGAADAFEKAAKDELRTIKGTRDEFYRAAPQKSARLQQLNLEIQTLRRSLEEAAQRRELLQQDIRAASERVISQGRGAESDQLLLDLLAQRQRSQADLASEIDRTSIDVENLASEEALETRRFLEAQSQLKAQEASVESASRNAAAIEAQWKAARLGGLPNAATLTNRRADLFKEIEETDRLLAEQQRLLTAYEKSVQNEELSSLSAQMDAQGGMGSSEEPQKFERILARRLENAQSKRQASESAKVTVMALSERLQKTAIDFSTRFLLPLNDLIEHFNEALLSYPGEMIRFKASHHVDRTKFDMQLKYRDRIDDVTYNTDLPPQIVLSEGQLAANGFSILCAASVAYPWSKWRALLLDDPLQHNDIIHTAAFVDLMRNLVERKGYQLLMSSHDRAEAEFIYRKFDAAGLPCTALELTAPSRDGVRFAPVRYNQAAKSAM